MDVVGAVEGHWVGTSSKSGLWVRVLRLFGAVMSRSKSVPFWTYLKAAGAQFLKSSRNQFICSSQPQNRGNQKSSEN